MTGMDERAKVTTKRVEIETFFDPESPEMFYFLPSGRADCVILVTEDPYFGIESRLLNKKEYDEIYGRLKAAVE